MSLEVIVEAIVILLGILGSLGIISIPGISNKIAEGALKGQKSTGMAKKIAEASDKLLTDGARDFGDGAISAEDLKNVFNNSKTIVDLVKGIVEKQKK